MTEHTFEDDAQRPTVGRADADADAVQAGADEESLPLGDAAAAFTGNPADDEGRDDDGVPVGSADADADQERALADSED